MVGCVVKRVQCSRAVSLHLPVHRCVWCIRLSVQYEPTLQRDSLHLRPPVTLTKYCSQLSLGISNILLPRGGSLPQKQGCHAAVNHLLAPCNQPRGGNDVLTARHMGRQDAGRGGWRMLQTAMQLPSPVGASVSTHNLVGAVRCIPQVRGSCAVWKPTASIV